MSIENPDHYTRLAIPTGEYIMRNDMEFWRGNVIKYVSRAGYKAKADMSMMESEREDLVKARRYIEMRLNMLDGKPEL
jgi:hypothetical protein